MNLLQRLKLLWELPEMFAQYQLDKEVEQRRVNNSIHLLQKRIGEVTTVHCDVHTKTPAQVIVIGRYGDKDFVKAYEISQKNLPELVKVIKAMEPYSNRGRFDMIGGMDFSALYPNDKF